MVSAKFPSCFLLTYVDFLVYGLVMTVSGFKQILYGNVRHSMWQKHLEI